MSYLAMSAAPYDNNNYENNDNTSLNQKKMSRNTAQNKADLLIDNEKVSQVLETINNLHKNANIPEDEGGDLGDFSPPPPPVSAGVVRTLNKESLPKPSYASTFENSGNELKDYKMNYGNEQTTNDYYKKYVPNYSPSTPYGPQYRPDPTKEDVLLEKLNYMIHLLEEQQDEKTNTVVEEVVLYCFLGIFIIYIADSFTRIGKYTR